MELSLEQAAPIAAKRRGRKPRSEALILPDQGSTIPDLEVTGKEEGGTKEKRKQKESSEVPKSAVQQVLKSQDKSKRKVESRKSEEDMGTSDSESSLFSDKHQEGYSGDLMDIAPATSYEWLGIRTVEPASRSPILPLTKENKRRVAWASRDCSMSGAMLRRARPFRSLEATFFDRLEVLRRVALSEVAKASEPMEAVAALGIVFDREMLMIGAEDTFGVTKGRALVQETAPGNYDELAGRIGAERKPRRLFRRRDSYARPEGTKQAKGQSKGAQPYVHSSFRCGGTEVLLAPRCPREERLLPPSGQGEQSGHRFDEPILEGMESKRSTEAFVPVVEKRCPSSMVWTSSNHKRKRRLGEERGCGSRTRDEQDGGRWSVHTSKPRRHIHIACLSYSQENRGTKDDTRSQRDQLASEGTPLLPARSKGGSGGSKRKPLAMCTRSTARLPTSIYGARCKKVLGCSSWRENLCLCSPSIRSVSQSLCIHKANEVGSQEIKRRNRFEGISLYRRFLTWGRHQGRIGGRYRKGQRIIQHIRGSIVQQETDRGKGRGGVSWVSMVREEEDYKCDKGEKKRVQEDYKEFTENGTTHCTLEEHGRKTHLFARGNWTGSAACAKYSEVDKGKENHGQDKTIWRSGNGFEMVARDTDTEKRLKLKAERNHSIDFDGRLRQGDWLCGGRRRLAQRRKLPSIECPLAHQHKRVGGLIGVLGKRRRSVRKPEDNMVFGQHDCQSSNKKTRNTKHRPGNMGNDKEDIRHFRGKEHHHNLKTCPWKHEQEGRCLVQGQHNAEPMGRSSWKDCLCMGTTRARPLRDDEGINRTIRRPVLGKETDTTETPNRCDTRCVGGAWRSEVQGRREGRASVPLGVMRSPNNTYMEEFDMVEGIGRNESRVDRLREATRGEFEGLGREKYASTIVDSLLDSDKGLLWAPRTRDKYRRVTERFVIWWLHRGRWKEETMKEKKDIFRCLARDIMQFLRQMSVSASGEFVNTAGRILFGMFERYLEPEDLERDRTQLEVLRRDANMSNPPTQHAADALKLRDLQKILERIERVQITPVELQAVEILTIAFATISRVAEIAALKISDVPENCQCISIRTKTCAKTWQRHVKRVSDGCGLDPTRVLKERRMNAKRYARSLLFSCSDTEDLQFTSAEVTKALKRVAKKVQLRCKLTSHSARKGAAVAALVAGVPIAVIQALGAWKCLESMQSYLGRAIRENYGILEILEHTRM